MPEYEIFDLGQLTTLQRLLDRYGLPAGGHVHVDFVMGVPGGMPGTAEALVACTQALRDLPDGHHVLGHRHRPHHDAGACSPRCRPAGTCGSAWRTPSRTPRASRSRATRSWSPGRPAFARLAQRPPMTTAEARPCSACPATAVRRERRVRRAACRSPRWCGPASWRAATTARWRCSTPAGRAGRRRPAIAHGPIFPRSSNKPMQAVGDAARRAALADPADLALVAASHSGEPFHVDRVRALLRSGRADRGRPALPAGPAAVARRPGTACCGPAAARRRCCMNCSGKHTGMLLTCVAAGWSTDGLSRPRRTRCRRRAGTAVEDLAGEPVAAIGVDGCGAPVLAISLTGLARAFLRLCRRRAGYAAAAVADAMRAHPELVSGTGRGRRAADARRARAAGQGRRRGRDRGRRARRRARWR